MADYEEQAMLEESEVRVSSGPRTTKRIAIVALMFAIVAIIGVGALLMKPHNDSMQEAVQESSIGWGFDALGKSSYKIKGRFDGDGFPPYLEENIPSRKQFIDAVDGTHGFDEKLFKCITDSGIRCNVREYMDANCVYPTPKNWKASKEFNGGIQTSSAACDLDPGCLGYTSYGNKLTAGTPSYNFATKSLSFKQSSDGTGWHSCIHKKRLLTTCEEGYVQYSTQQPAWCSWYYNSTAKGPNSGREAQKKCEADPGCIGYSTGVFTSKVWLINNRPLVSETGRLPFSNSPYAIVCLKPSKQGRFQGSYKEFCAKALDDDEATQIPKIRMGTPTLVRKPPEGCIILNVGPSRRERKVGIWLGKSGWQCPPVFSRNNWASYDALSDAQFHVTTRAFSSRTTVYVQKDPVGEWDMDLRIFCCNNLISSINLQLPLRMQTVGIDMAAQQWWMDQSKFVERMRSWLEKPRDAMNEFKFGSANKMCKEKPLREGWTRPNKINAGLYPELGAFIIDCKTERDPERCEKSQKVCAYACERTNNCKYFAVTGDKSLYRRWCSLYSACTLKDQGYTQTFKLPKPWNSKPTGAYAEWSDKLQEPLQKTIAGMNLPFKDSSPINRG